MSFGEKMLKIRYSFWHNPRTWRTHTHRHTWCSHRAAKSSGCNCT